MCVFGMCHRIIGNVCVSFIVYEGRNGRVLTVNRIFVQEINEIYC